MAVNGTSTAFTPPPYYASVSECADVYGGEKHWAILADNERGIVADIEGGLRPKAKKNAAFIVRACNAHADLRKASGDLYHRIQEYLDVSDEQLIEQGYNGLVQAMDDLEAAWHKADGTQPERHETAA